MDGIETILRILEDGSWHSTAELALRLGWAESKTEKIVKFLSAHGLVRFQGKTKSVSLEPELLALMKEF